MIKDILAFKACLISCYLTTLPDTAYMNVIDALLCEIASYRISGDKNKGLKIIPAIQEEFAIGDDILQSYKTVAEELYKQTVKIIHEVKNDSILIN